MVLCHKKMCFLVFYLLLTGQPLLGSLLSLSLSLSLCSLASVSPLCSIHLSSLSSSFMPAWRLALEVFALALLLLLRSSVRPPLKTPSLPLLTHPLHSSLTLHCLFVEFSIVLSILKEDRTLHSGNWPSAFCTSRGLFTKSLCLFSL